MKFSIVMPSFLGPYPGAAKNRVQKFKRAVRSVYNQTFQDWELLIVADGCEDTVAESLLLAAELQSGSVRGYYIDKCPLWAGTPRNEGITRAQGEYILYLDTDDTYTPDYLSRLNRAIAERPGKWFLVPDLIPYNGSWRERPIGGIKLGGAGTSNIIHQPGVLWEDGATYAHDYRLIKRLRDKFGEPTILTVAGYQVQHIPNRYDL